MNADQACGERVGCHPEGYCYESARGRGVCLERWQDRGGIQASRPSRSRVSCWNLLPCEKETLSLHLVLPVD